MVPKLWCTGRNAQQSRWSPSHFKVSLRPNSWSICPGSTTSLTAPSMFYLCAGRNTKHTSQPCTVSLAFEMTLSQKTQARLSCCRSLRSYSTVPSPLCSKAGETQDTWTADTHRIPTACKQQGHTAHELPVTHCAQQFHSWNSCHSNSAHFFPEKL